MSTVSEPNFAAALHKLQKAHWPSLPPTTLRLCIMDAMYLYLIDTFDELEMQEDSSASSSPSSTAPKGEAEGNDDANARNPAQGTSLEYRIAVFTAALMEDLPKALGMMSVTQLCLLRTISSLRAKSSELVKTVGTTSYYCIETIVVHMGLLVAAEKHPHLLPVDCHVGVPSLQDPAVFAKMYPKKEKKRQPADTSDTQAAPDAATALQPQPSRIATTEDVLMDGEQEVVVPCWLDLIENVMQQS